MKAAISLSLALLALTSAHAQIFGPGAVNGAFLGGIAGAVIGHNSGSLHHNGWQGAAIGAGAGLLLGAAADASAARYDGYGAPVYPGGYVYREGYRGAGYGYYGYPGSAAVDGLWLGALAGGIIGNNSRGFHHNGWRGAAWGAGLGWVLGSIADAGYYSSGYPRTVVVPQAQAAPQPAAAAPQQVTIINNYYGNASPMSQANTLFGR